MESGIPGAEAPFCPSEYRDPLPGLHAQPEEGCRDFPGPSPITHMPLNGTRGSGPWNPGQGSQKHQGGHLWVERFAPSHLYPLSHCHFLQVMLLSLPVFACIGGAPSGASVGGGWKLGVCLVSIKDTTIEKFSWNQFNYLGVGR